MRRAVPLLFFLAGCASESPHEDATLPLRVGTHSELTAPSPFAPDGLGATIEELVFRGPLREDEKGQVLDDLAESHFVEGGSKLVLRLHSGSRFSDGTPLTARDVADTFQHAGELGFLRGQDQIREVRIADDQTVEVKIARPFTRPLALTWGVTKRGAPAPVGDGPYLVASRDASKLVLRANPFWSGAPPGVKTIEFDFFPRASDEWGRLLAREVDLITFIPWAKHEFLQTIPSVREVTALSKTLYQIHFAHPVPPFDVPEVRYALSLAIDREALVREVVRGHGKTAVGLVWPLSPAFDATVSPYPYDPDEARRILLRHGIAPGEDGRLRAGGRPLELAITFVQGFTEVEETALLIERQLGEIGLRVELTAASLPQISGVLERDGSGAFLLPWHATDDLLADPEVRAFVSSPQTSAPAAPKVAALAQLQRRVRDEPPSIYLFWPERLDIISRRFCGLPHLPDAPESSLQLVHPCAPGEDN